MFEAFFRSATQVTILRINGTDSIRFFFEEAPSTYPELAAEHLESYAGATFSVETRRGYAEEWLRINHFSGKVQLITKSGSSEVQI